MGNPNPLHFHCGPAVALVAACLIAPVFAGEPARLSGLAERELAKRSAAVEEALELLKKGDESYKAGRYGEATQAYSGARDLIPEASYTAELRFSATERFAQSSVQYGRELAKKGDIAGAKALVEKVLLPEVAPNDPGALVFQGELHDPIRTNPALDSAHSRNVDEVRRLLYIAEGAYNLGKYDEAKSTYERVLRIDPYNTAGRRGLERLAAAKTDYLNAAYDHTRSELLGQVAAAWELPLEPLAVDPGLTDPGVANSGSGSVPIANRLSRFIIPKVGFEQTSLSEAVDFLRLSVSKDGSGLGAINFTVNLGDAAAAIEARRFDLQLSNAPLGEVLKYITELTGTLFTTDEFAVNIRPLGSTSTELISRSFKVPPGFIDSISSGAASPAAAVDPFAAAPAEGQGLLPKRLGVKEALISQGVAFPEGASAILYSSNNTLRVTNTAANLEIIGQIIETTVQTEPVNIAVRVTIIKTEQRNLDELGYDWLLEGFDFGPAGSIPGTNVLNLAGGTQGSGGDLSDLSDPTSGVPVRPITAGNRSGDSAIDGNSIDDLIALGNRRAPQGDLRAPGVLKVNGILDGNMVTALMRGLAQKKGVDLLTEPSTVTRSGQASSIRVIREFIYPTEYEPPEIPQTIPSTDLFLNGAFVGSLGSNLFPVTPATPTAFEKRDVGVILEVLPTADANKRYVEITLKPTVTDFDGFVNYGSPIGAPPQGGVAGVGGSSIEVTPNAILMPVFSTSRADTSITIADGATIVIGGLLRDNIQNVEDKTPVLGDLPVVGRFFKSQSKQTVSTAIVFLVNVELLDPTGRPYRNR